MLQEYLDLNFIKIKEDENLNKLKKACEEVTKKINKNKPKIRAYTLTAFDPEISPDNPDIKEVQDAIVNIWNTFNANNKDTKITIIRAVMLEALSTISKDTMISCLIWLSSRDIIKYYSLGREKKVLIDFLLNLGNQIESKSLENWSLQNLKLFFKTEKFNIDVKEITGSTEEINVNQTHLQKTVNKLIEGFTQMRNNIHSEISEYNHMLQMRTQLLWWKEASYSLSLNQSYSELKSGVLQIALAYDYALLVPYLYPNSADYFLREVHKNLLSEHKKNKILDILKLTIQAKTQLKKIFAEYEVETARIPLISFLKGLIWDKYTPKQFKKLVGINESTEITLDDFTIWLYHDLQAHKISTIGK